MMRVGVLEGGVQHLAGDEADEWGEAERRRAVPPAQRLYVAEASSARPAAAPAGGVLSVN